MEKRRKRKPGQGKASGRLGGVSRREFIRDAGLVVGVPAVGSMATRGGAATQAAAAGPGAGTERRGAACATEVIELTVNGDRYRCDVEPHWSLRRLLRDELGFTSIKDWCGGQGACGSCTVVMNGRPILSCLTLASECDGAKIETAEGIAKAKHPIIQAYINNNAFQCGYCTPGFVCTAKALLDRNKEPAEAEVRDALSGNLCRCGTYQQHPVAVLEAARNL